MTAAVDPSQQAAWRQAAVDAVRGMSGGLLFGVPLLYTMEMWWSGEHTRPAHAVVVLVLSLVPIIALNRTAGFRTGGDATWRDAVIDAVEALGISVVLAGAVLFVLREITGSTPVLVAASKVAYQTLPFGIGVAVANHFLSGRKNRSEDTDRGQREAVEGERRRPRNQINGTAADLAATLVGATFIALNVAPTDEVPMIAASMGPAWLILLVGLSVTVTYAIVFVAGFAGQRQRHAQRGVLQHPLSETLAAYTVSLVGAALMLAVFQRLNGPPAWMLAQAVVLAFPASIGGAAGRLAL